MKIAAILTSAILIPVALLGEKVPPHLIFPAFQHLETPIFNLLNQVLKKDSGLVFLPEDVMKISFMEKVKDSQYGCYVYYDRGYQISGPGGGGYFGDFIENAKEHADFDGFVVPIKSDNNTNSPLTLDNIMKAYLDVIKDESDLKVVFLLEYNLLNTVIHTRGYKNGDFNLSFISKLDRGESLSAQSKKLRKYDDKLPNEATVCIDLRNPQVSENVELTKYIHEVLDLKKMVYFNTDEQSINAFAEYLDVISNIIQQAAGGDGTR